MDDWEAGSDDEDDYKPGKRRRMQGAGSRGKPKKKAQKKYANIYHKYGHDREIEGIGAIQIPVAVRQKNMNALQRARAVLTLSALPKHMPCREKERETIMNFVAGAVQGDEDGRYGVCGGGAHTFDCQAHAVKNFIVQILQNLFEIPYDFPLGACIFLACPVLERLLQCERLSACCVCAVSRVTCLISSSLRSTL